MFEVFKELFGDLYAPIALSLIRIAAMVMAAFFLLRLISSAAQRFRKLVDDGDVSTVSRTEKRAETLGQIIRSVSKAAILVVLALMVTQELGIDIGPVLAGVGILGLAIGFGAQSLVKDVISGFFILFEDQFGVGDTIRIGDLSGEVERMTLRATVLRNLQGEVHIIPNGAIQTVSVLTKEWSRAVVDVSVAYKENLDRVCAVLNDVAGRLAMDWPDAILETPVILGVEDLADSGVTVRVAAKTHPMRRVEVMRELRKRIKDAFDQQGIEIPFPQRTIRIVADRH